jgi:hypothetical protein
MITPDATSEPEITGVYIWKKDKFDPADQIFTAAGKDLIGVDPQDMPSAQLNWLIDHINAIDEAIPHGGYPSLIDVESFADHHIFNVFANNADGLNFSTFYHKDRGGLVRMGPVWDFDRSMACDIDAFKARYPAWNTYNIMGGFTGSLENSGERLLLGYDTPGGITLADISYADGWYPLTDGTGFSLVLRDAQSDPAGWNSREAWRHSASIDGTPGEADPDPRATLVHYWNFNQSASLLDPTRTKGDGAMAVGLSGSAAILASTGQDFFAENARDGDPAGSHLRVNYPLGATLTLALPTCGFDGIVVAYETRRSGQGAGLQQVEVTTDGMNYSPFATIPVLDAPPVLRMLDFRGFPGAAVNPMFGLRITFEQGAGGNAGNNRIDNLTVDGTPIDFAHWRAFHFENPADFANDAVSGPLANPSGDGVNNLIRYALSRGPFEPVAGLLPVIETTAGPALRFRFHFDADKSDLRWRVLASRDLHDWSHVLHDTAVHGPPPEVPGWHSAAVAIPASLAGEVPGSDPQMFLRLELTIISAP